MDYPKSLRNYSKTFADVKHLGLKIVGLAHRFSLLAKLPSLETLTVIMPDPNGEKLLTQKNSLFCLVTWEERSSLAQRLDAWLDGEEIIQRLSRPAKEIFADYNTSHELEPLTFEFSVKILGVQHSM